MALVCLLAHLSGAFHLVLERHERCAEHGEWVHAGDAQHASQPSAPTEPGSRITPLAPAGDHGHEHCLLFGERRDAALPSPVVAAVLLPFAAAGVTQAVRGVEAGTQAVYAFAPKTSPPLGRS